jgi:hypothetical protein
LYRVVDADHTGTSSHVVMGTEQTTVSCNLMICRSF